MADIFERKYDKNGLILRKRSSWIKENIHYNVKKRDSAP